MRKMHRVFGKKGLHLTVLGDEYRYLSKTARREIVEYIEGTKLDRTILFRERKGMLLVNQPLKVGEEKVEPSLNIYLKRQKAKRRKRFYSSV